MDEPDPKYDLGQTLRLPAGERAAPVERELCRWGGHRHWAYRFPSCGWHFEGSLKDFARSKPYNK